MCECVHMCTCGTKTYVGCIITWWLRAQILESYTPRFKSCLCHLLALWPWANCLTFLRLSLLIWKLIITCTPRILWEPLPLFSEHESRFRDHQKVPSVSRHAPSRAPQHSFLLLCLIVSHPAIVPKAPGFLSQSAPGIQLATEWELPLLLTHWPFNPHKSTHQAHADFSPEGLGQLQKVGTEHRALVYFALFLDLTRKDVVLRDGPLGCHLHYFAFGPQVQRHTILFGLLMALPLF